MSSLNQLGESLKLTFRREIQGQLIMPPEIFGLQKKKILIISAFVLGISTEYLVLLIRSYHKPQFGDPIFSFSSKKMQPNHTTTTLFAICQLGPALTAFTINSLVWSKQGTFSRIKHIAHYFCAVICLTAMVPFQSFVVTTLSRYFY